MKSEVYILDFNFLKSSMKELRSPTLAILVPRDPTFLTPAMLVTRERPLSQNYVVAKTQTVLIKVGKVKIRSVRAGVHHLLVQWSLYTVCVHCQVKESSCN